MNREEFGIFVDSNIAQGLEYLKNDGSYPIEFRADGLLSFVEGAFPNARPDQVFAQLVKREPGGSGPHFDLYHDGLDRKYPWVGVFNLAGECQIEAVPLPTDLAESYFTRFTEPTDEAWTARRQFGAIALGDPNGVVKTAVMRESSGILITQHPERPHVVHQVMPSSNGRPGSFVKLSVPNPESEYAQMHIISGEQSLDTFVTSSLQKAHVTDHTTEQRASVPRSEALRPHRGGVPGRID